MKVAKNLLANGAPMELICVSTGLSRREVEELRDGMTDD